MELRDSSGRSGNTVPSRQAMAGGGGRKDGMNMTPNEQINVGTGGGPVRDGLAMVRASSVICLLAGIWFFVSPWVYGAYTTANAWNSWIVGALIIFFSIFRISRPAYSAALSWCNMVLGIWTFFSPWIYGYVGVNAGRFINSLCVGVIVFVFAIISARMSAPHNVTTTHL